MRNDPGWRPCDGMEHDGEGLQERTRARLEVWTPLVADGRVFEKGRCRVFSPAFSQPHLFSPNFFGSGNLSPRVASNLRP